MICLVDECIAENRTPNKQGHIHPLHCLNCFVAKTLWLADAQESFVTKQQVRNKSTKHQECTKQKWRGKIGIQSVTKTE